jgi:hypothetical protein
MPLALADIHVVPCQLLTIGGGQFSGLALAAAQDEQQDYWYAPQPR